MPNSLKEKKNVNSQKNSQKPTKRNKKRKNKNSKEVFKTVGIVFVILLLLFVASETFQVGTVSSTKDSLKSWFNSLSSGDGYPYKISSSSIKSIDMMSSNLFLVTDDSTIILDKTAKETSKINHTYTNPGVSINNGRAIVYDRGGNRYLVQSRTEKLFSGKTDSDILTCDIGATGNIAVGTCGKNSTNYVTVYKSKGKKEIFKWACNAEKIVNISLSDNGKNMAVAVVSAKDADILSKVYVFNFKNNEAIATINYPNTAIYKIDYVSNNDILVIGDNNRSLISNNTKKTKEVDFGTSTLTRFSIDESGVNADILSEYGSSNLNSLKVYSKDNKELFTKKFKTPVKSVYCEGRYINVLTDNKIKVYDTRGRLKKEIPVKSDSMKVLSNGRRKYIFGVGELRQKS